ncbi:MAG: AtpZ/AtpI family protein [Phreatobacter sp.]|uniref:AtpZ/AtpI family protein n=1 Tax=Phreatobacter sp. TaxID=1966341 RepID=UPI001A41817E|nr:AtpZ/AtpI family protein [Phreatobacter sp.]MBL8570621.1 AtpZ/AtpI family protein [Phreatobacter sp.]
MVEDGKRQGSDQGPPTEADLDARRRALESKLAAYEQQRTSGTAPVGQAAVEPSGLVKLFRFSADFVSGVIAGALIGWLVDRFAGTRPWGLIVFLLLGFATGIYNLVRSAQRANRGG